MILLRTALARGRVRAAVGLVCAMVFAVAAPSGVRERAWAAATAMMAAPWLVLGRTDRLRAEGWADALRSARTPWRWVAAELAAPWAVVMLGALAGGAGELGATAALAGWGTFCVTLADALDRRTVHAGSAAALTHAVLLALFTAPWWLAPLLGRGLGHGLATWTFGTHPAAVALAATERSPLQDALFYRWTLSGTVDARPMPWALGLAFWWGLTSVMLGLAVRRPRANHP